MLQLWRCLHLEDHDLGGIAGRRSINSRSRMAVMMDKILKKKIKVKFLIASLYTFPRHDYQVLQSLS